MARNAIFISYSHADKQWLDPRVEAVRTHVGHPPARGGDRLHPRPRRNTRTREAPAGAHSRTSLPSPTGTVEATSPDAEIASPSRSRSKRPSEISRTSVPEWRSKTTATPSLERDAERAGRADELGGAPGGSAISCGPPPSRKTRHRLLREDAGVADLRPGT